jgi:aminoglycoside 3-N-acetyltransferase
MDYGAQNLQAEMFHPDLPVHESLGPLAEALRHLEQAQRSSHPVLSFAAVGEHAQEIVSTQTTANALGPLQWLYDNGGAVLLLGADHTANVAIHLAERMAGRKQFVRWAIDKERAYRLEGFPGCSRGFEAIAPKLAWVTQQTTIGPASAQRIPMRSLVDTAVQMIQVDPAALLCSDDHCALCVAVRHG